jgi:hypothetical protein
MSRMRTAHRPLKCTASRPQMPVIPPLQLSISLSVAAYVPTPPLLLSLCPLIHMAARLPLVFCMLVGERGWGCPTREPFAVSPPRPSVSVFAFGPPHAPHDAHTHQLGVSFSLPLSLLPSSHTFSLCLSLCLSLSLSRGLYAAWTQHLKDNEDKIVQLQANIRGLLQRRADAARRKLWQENEDLIVKVRRHDGSRDHRRGVRPMYVCVRVCVRLCLSLADTRTRTRAGNGVGGRSCKRMRGARRCGASTRR